MVEVFKTNVECVEQSKMIVQRLLHHFPGTQINFDLEDCDRILRVAGSISSGMIISLMNQLGYSAEVLD